MSWLKKHSKIATVLILSLLIATVSVAGTLAYIVDETDSIGNNFIPVSVSCQPTAKDGGIAVLNSGEIDAYIRATVVVNWVMLDHEGNATGTFYADAPAENLDYSISYNSASGWKKGSDGFWYYTLPVNPNGITEVLISEYSRMAPAPEGYALSIEVLCSAVQSMPTQAVETVFGVTVNGTTLVVD